MEDKLNDIQVHLKGVDVEIMKLKDIIIKLQHIILDLQTEKIRYKGFVFEYSVDSDDSDTLEGATRYPPSDED